MTRPRPLEKLSKEQQDALQALDLIYLLKRIEGDLGEKETATLRKRTVQETVTLPKRTLQAIIALLSKLPKPRGSQSAIRGRALVRQNLAVVLALGRQRQLVDEQREKVKLGTAAKVSTVDAQWQAAEEAVPTFRKLTGRKLSAETIRDLMRHHRAPRRRTVPNPKSGTGYPPTKPG